MKRVNPVKTVYGMNNSKTVEQKESEPANMQNKATESSSMKMEEDIYEMIRKYHATLIVASNMLKSFHYTVVGMGFYTIHPKIQELYTQIDEYIDSVAELLISEEKNPVLHLSEALALSSIAEYKFSGQITCKQSMTQINKVFDVFENMTDTISSLIDNVGISGMFGEHYLYFSKANWMIRAYLQG